MYLNLLVLKTKVLDVYINRKRIQMGDYLSMCQSQFQSQGGQ